MKINTFLSKMRTLKFLTSRLLKSNTLKRIKTNSSINMATLLATLMLVSTAHASDSARLLHKDWKKLQSEHYLQPTAEELKIAQDLFGKLFNGVIDESLQKQFNAIGFKLTHKKYAEESFFIVEEINQPLRGNGMYIIRSKFNHKMLQAPHAYKDLHTGKLALKLLIDGGYGSLAINTVPRRYAYKGLEVTADMAHLENTFFISFSHAFVKARPDGHIIQLHGFNSAKRLQTQDISLIISNGVKTTSRHLMRQVTCLRQSVTKQVRAYPAEINTLGGTTNSIGKHLRKMGSSNFSHVEMNLDLRKQLLASKKLRDAFSNCLLNNDSMNTDN